MRKFETGARVLYYHCEAGSWKRSYKTTKRNVENESKEN